MKYDDRLIEIIEDHTSMGLALRIVRETLETKVLPSEGVLPVFNDTLVADDFISCLELAARKKYKK